MFLFGSLFFYCCLFVFVGPHLWHIAVPRLGVQSQLWLLAYSTATAMQDPSQICNLHHRSLQHQNLSPLREARDQTHNLMVPSLIHFHCAMIGTPERGHCLSQVFMALFEDGKADCIKGAPRGFVVGNCSSTPGTSTSMAQEQLGSVNGNLLRGDVRGRGILAKVAWQEFCWRQVPKAEDEESDQGGDFH